MNAVTVIKNTGLRTKAIYNNCGELIATASKVLKKDSDYGRGVYRICIYGGPAHGKMAYAQSLEDLNEKSVEIAML